MKPFKFVSVWLTLLAVVLCLINLLTDDNHLLLYVSSPILWFLEGYSPFLLRFITFSVLIALYSLISIICWFYVGIIIDCIIHASIRKRLIWFLSRSGIVICIIALVSVIFYTYQSSDKRIIHILQHADQYNEQSLRMAVIRSAKEGYAHNHMQEFSTIIQTTKSSDVHKSTMYALGLIGTPHAVKLIVENTHDYSDHMHILSSNERTIVSMLKLNQPLDIIQAGIEAAYILKFSSFVEPLNKLQLHHPDPVIQDKTGKVIQRINQNPQVNNPKYDID